MRLVAVRQSELFGAPRLAWKDNPFGTFVDWNPRILCVDRSPASE
jgi:hypothetical protein